MLFSVSFIIFATMMMHSIVDQTWAGFLGRAILHRDDASTRSVHAGRSVLVTGAAGSIGSVLARALATASPRRLILLDRSRRRLDSLTRDIRADSPNVPLISVVADITHAPALDHLFATQQPEVVYHAAAFKHVPQLESDPFVAIRNNALGTDELSRAAVRHHSETLVMISTDKAVNPHSIMGATKRIAEMILMRGASGQTCMRALRLGNVLASRGSVVPVFRRQILHGGPVTVTHPEVSRYFFTLGEAGTLVLAAASLSGSGSILVPQLGSPHKIVDLARYMIDGQDDIPVVFTGLRPGEKMAEQMLSSCETVDPKAELELYRVHNATAPLDNLDDSIAALEQSATQNNLAAALRIVQRMVPEYKPSDSLTQLLDSGHHRMATA
ncbi:MAG TPA: polysaccharide biosynthesis protein [Terriglobia bacterium]|nr:polysaccharide biosynthesis protein [Terriglobia bacterium]